MTIALITGSCGLVGSESSIFFSKKGFKILGVDNNTRKLLFGKDGDISWIRKKLKKNLRNYEHFNYDIKNYSSLEKIFKKYKKNISIIIHTAAQPSHDWAKNKAFIDFEINAKGTLNLLELTNIRINSYKAALKLKKIYEKFIPIFPKFNTKNISSI